MTINFIIKPAAAKGKKRISRYPGYKKVYIRLRDGRSIDQTSNTNIFVTPEAWDFKLELLDAAKCPEELEWEKINDALSDLRKYVTRKYISDSLSCRIGPLWLKDSLAEYRRADKCYSLDIAFDDFIRAKRISCSRPYC